VTAQVLQVVGQLEVHETAFGVDIAREPTIGAPRPPPGAGVVTSADPARRYTPRMDIHDLLRRVPDACDPDALTTLEGTIQFEISRPVWHEVRGGRVQVHDGRAVAPDAVVEASDGLLADLYAGRANPVLAFMTGKLKVKGDVGLVKRLIEAVDRDRLGQAG
jgi:hypothetical protein